MVEKSWEDLVDFLRFRFYLKPNLGIGTRGFLERFAAVRSRCLGAGPLG